MTKSIDELVDAFNDSPFLSHTIQEQPDTNEIFDLQESYRPSEDEPYMNPRQLEYFRRKLLNWRKQLIKESNDAILALKEGVNKETDFIDRGTLEADISIKVRSRDRCRKLIYKIDEALLRIEDGSFGYCEETDEEIGLMRLEARPIARLSMEAQKRHERSERLRKPRN